MDDRFWKTGKKCSHRKEDKEGRGRRAGREKEKNRRKNMETVFVNKERKKG